MYTIVVIEDEEDLLELIEYNLQKTGFETIGFLSTKNVKKLLTEEKIDLMIVDRNLPNVEGSEFVKNLRNEGINIPTIFVSAKDKDSDIEEGFERGGDDYMTKPFNMKELILRIKAILARVNPSKLDNIEYRDIYLDTKSRKTYIAKKEIELTKLEFELLKTLIENKNSVLNREFLLTHVWRDETFFQDKTVNVAVNRLKKKIDPDGSKEYIKSIWGVGYTLK
ncbi:MAG TPA: DNA-binding response regulator [Sulfurospirillum sp. UBA11407]|jgi:DNA-binding response OmpR family regulator|nr:MAG TPA: DNA-binding response regulator [Sulfurospirillum sp. UBA11407]DAB34586.1 MAG TPA: DNA-binding response regulator [Sulfurospirillum sp. UBA12182]